MAHMATPNFTMKHIIATLAVLMAFVGLASAASAQCGLLNIDYVDQAAIAQGGSGGFTITAYNSGESTQRISASAYCDNRELDCSFAGISDDSTLVAPGERKTFSLDVQSTGPAGIYQINGELRAGVSAATCTTPLTFNLNVGQTNASGSSAGINPLNAWIEPNESVNARPSDTVQYTIGLRNNGNKRIYAAISSMGTNPFESSTSLSASDVALEAGQTKLVTVAVHLPAGTPGGSYSWIYKVDAGICCGYSTTLTPIQINVQGPLLNIELRNAPLQDECTAVHAGESQTFNPSLKNNGNVNGPFDLTISGSATATRTVTISQTRIEIKHGEETPFTLTIAPSVRTPIGIYFYKLRGTYQGFTFLNRQLCFNVVGVETTRVAVPEEFTIEREHLSTTTINITNNGTVADEYALTPEQMDTSDMVVNLQPNSFSLTPGQTQTITVTVTSDLETALGERNLTIRLDAQNYSSNIELSAKVVASGKVGESLMEVTVDREIYAPPGASKVFQVSVENKARHILRDVSITIESSDLDASQYSAEPQSIFPGDTATFDVTVNLPTNAASQTPVNITVRSGEEFVKIPAVLFASATANLAFTIFQVIENKNSNDEVTSVNLLINVTNNGQTTVNSIVGIIDDNAYIYSQIPTELSLQPGETSQVRINVKAAGGDTQNKDVALHFASQAGSTQAQSISLPALTVQPTNLTWKAVAILLLLIGIGLLIARRQN